MKKETFEKAIELDTRLNELEKAKMRASQYNITLGYGVFVESENNHIHISENNFIHDILDRHHQQIIKEIEDEIKAINEEIERL